MSSKNEPLRIVFLFEGTRNDPQNESVISRLAKIIDTSNQQLIHCESGSGTSGGWFKRVKGAASGCDSFEIVSRHYKWLSSVIFERKLESENVELYVFGFSRGAYQARLFVELISRFGLPMTVDSASVKVARFALGIRGKRKEFLPALNSCYQRMIRFLGLFDMVRALWHKDIYSKLGPLPNHIDVRHALAIHEKRSFFFPVLEDIPGSQVMWFAGVHSDVGWGYNKEGEKASTLGLISISWMLKNLPLTLKHEFSRIPYCFMDMLLLFSCFGFLRHESYRGLWKLLLQRSRKRIMGNKHPTVKAVEEVISELNIHPAMLWRTRFMSESLRKYLNCRGIRKSQKKLLRNIAEVNKIFLRYKVYQSPCQLPTCLISRATGPCLFPRQDRLS